MYSWVQKSENILGNMDFFFKPENKQVLNIFLFTNNYVHI